MPGKHQVPFTALLRMRSGFEVGTIFAAFKFTKINLKYIRDQHPWICYHYALHALSVHASLRFDFGKVSNVLTEFPVYRRVIISLGPVNYPRLVGKQLDQNRRSVRLIAQNKQVCCAKMSFRAQKKLLSEGNARFGKYSPVRIIKTSPNNKLIDIFSSISFLNP